MSWARHQWDRLLAVATLAIGALTLFAGWRGVSSTAFPAEQLPYIISGGIGGLFLLGASTALWLSADLRDEWHKLDRIEEAIRSQHGADPGARPDTTGPTESSTTAPRSNGRPLAATPAKDAS